MSDVDEGPRPGDPRSDGPRPPGTGKDLAWATLAVSVSVVTVVQLIGLTLAVTRIDGPGPSGGALFLGFVVTVVWLMTIWWLVMGAWRRTVWGCPFDHLDDAAQARQCPRHATVGHPTHDRLPDADRNRPQP